MTCGKKFVGSRNESGFSLKLGVPRSEESEFFRWMKKNPNFSKSLTLQKNTSIFAAQLGSVAIAREHCVKCLIKARKGVAKKQAIQPPTSGGGIYQLLTRKG